MGIPILWVDCCDVARACFLFLRHPVIQSDVWATLPYENLEAARRSVFKYIETFYNPERLHQTLDYKSPDQFEADHAPAAAA